MRGTAEAPRGVVRLGRWSVVTGVSVMSRRAVILSA